MHSMSRNLQEYFFFLDKQNICQLPWKSSYKQVNAQLNTPWGGKKPRSRDQLLHQHGTKQLQGNPDFRDPAAEVPSRKTK